MVAVLTAACITVLGVAIQIAATPRSAAADPAPSSAVTRTSRPVSTLPPDRGASKPSASSTSSAVVRKFLAAISSHNWPEVWTLGGKNIGRGPYASYTGMVAGYRGTIRDVPTTLRASGRTVSGRFLAYQTDGEVVTYAFTYVVQGGTIVRSDACSVRTVRY